MYTLDTNIIIYYLTGDRVSLEFMREHLVGEAPLYVSTATEHELYSYSKLTIADERNISTLLKSVTIMTINSRVAQISAQLRRDYNVKSLDAFIAATALLTGSALATRNVRDFRRVPQLSLCEL